MISSYIAEFSAVWKLLFRMPLPSFLPDKGGSDFPEIDSHPALMRPLMPVEGALFGLMLAFPFWVLQLFPGGKLTASIVGAIAMPLFAELLTAWSGLNALAAFIDLRRSGHSQEEALTAIPDSIDEPRAGSSMLILMILYVLRMIFFAVIAMYAPFWFIVTMTCGWLLRAELTTLNRPGTPMEQPWIAVPRGKEKQHWYLAAYVLLPVAVFFPISTILAYIIAGCLVWLAKNLCLESISGINRQAFEVFGYAAELLLLFLGILIYAKP